MVHVGNDANASINQLKLELENAETTAKQEALAVNYANDRTCAIHVEMLELSNQNLEMKHTMSNNIRWLENVLHYADTHRESIMRDFRNELRSENDRYEECEHHLAMEESQLQLQQVRNESLQMQLNTSESRSSDESIAKAGGMRDMRLMELRSELHMKQSLLDRTQQQLTESKNQYHELACQQARRSSPSQSPHHAEFQLEMYQKTAQECERVKKEKTDLFREYRNLQREVVDNEALIKTYQHNFDVLGKKYQDAVERLNFLSTHPKVTGDMFDDLHDTIQDRDDTIQKLKDKITKLEESETQQQRYASKAISMLNDPRLVIHGATDYSIPETHLTDMHKQLSENRTEMDEMSNMISALKLENQAATSSSQSGQMTLMMPSGGAHPRNECEEKCAKLKAEMEEMKQEKNSEERALREALRKMEERKDHYKNNFSQAEDRAYDEEQEFRAEARAFEKLRNEYNANVLEMENMEKDKSKSSVSLREAEKISLQPWPKITELSSWKGSVVHEICIASGDRNHDDWKAWLAPCLVDQPDLQELAKTPETRFQSIDAKCFEKDHRECRGKVHASEV